MPGSGEARRGDTLAAMKKWLLSYDLASVLVFVDCRSLQSRGRRIGGGHTPYGRPVSDCPRARMGGSTGLAGSGLAARWRAGVLAVTVVVGMLLRRFVFDDGTQLSFILVATAFLTLFLLGWRVGRDGGRTIGGG